MELDNGKRWKVVLPENQKLKNFMIIIVDIDFIIIHLSFHPNDDN